jgi:2-polyprenyl-3-methyl-5-hydroxy-6-metoxy-1,4-benzoquinol methylase
MWWNARIAMPYQSPPKPRDKILQLFVMMIRACRRFTSSVKPDEVTKFNALAKEWWRPDGPLKMLHLMNPCRVGFIQSRVEVRGMTVLDVGCGGGILSHVRASFHST